MKRCCKKLKTKKNLAPRVSMHYVRRIRCLNWASEVRCKRHDFEQADSQNHGLSSNFWVQHLSEEPGIETFVQNWSLDWDAMTGICPNKLIPGGVDVYVVDVFLLHYWISEHVRMLSESPQNCFVVCLFLLYLLQKLTLVNLDVKKFLSSSSEFNVVVGFSYLENRPIKIAMATSQPSILTLIQLRTVLQSGRK